MPRRAKTFIYVNRHHVKANQQTGSNKPVITVEQRGKRRYGHQVRIDGPSEIVYRPDNPRSCGARVWITTYADVEVIQNERSGKTECKTACRRRRPRKEPQV